MPRCILCGEDNTWSGDTDIVDAFLSELTMRGRKKWCVSESVQRCCSLVCVRCCEAHANLCVNDTASCGRCRQKMNVWIAVNIPEDKIKHGR